MTATVVLGAIAVVGAIAIIIQTFQIAKLQKDRDEQRGDHNTLVGKVSTHAQFIKILQEPDPDRERMIICLLDLMHPRKYPDFYSFTDANGRNSFIVSTYITYDKHYPFQESSFSRHYTYVIQGPLAFPGSLTVSESYLDTIAKVREETLKECKEKKTACKREPACKKKKGGKK